MNRSIGPSLVGSLLMGAGFLSLDTFVPLYVQGGLGGGATAADVTGLMREVRARVAEQWGVTLEPEVKLIGVDGGIGSL